jgi:hypothetical protein
MLGLKAAIDGKRPAGQGRCRAHFGCTAARSALPEADIRSGGRGYSAAQGHAMVQRAGDTAQSADKAEKVMNLGGI